MERSDLPHSRNWYKKIATQKGGEGMNVSKLLDAYRELDLVGELRLNTTLLKAKDGLKNRILTLDGVVNEVGSRIDESIRSPHLVFKNIITLGVGNQVGLPVYGGEGLVSSSMIKITNSGIDHNLEYRPKWPPSAAN